VRPEEEIAFAESHAAAMGEEIADGHFVGDVGVVHLEAGEALVDGIVPGNFVGVDEGGESGGGEGFGVGADAEEGVFVDGGGSSEFADAIAFGEDGLAVFDDRDRKTGDIEGFQSARDVGVEVRRRGSLGLRLNRRTKDKDEKYGDD